MVTLVLELNNEGFRPLKLTDFGRMFVHWTHCQSKATYSMASLPLQTKGCSPRGFVVAVTGREGTPQVLVVASQRDGSTHSHAHTQRTHSLDPQDMPPSEGCCRAAVPLLLVLLLTGFLLLSGFLFYFNSKWLPDLPCLPVLIGIDLCVELTDTVREWTHTERGIWNG